MKWRAEPVALELRQGLVSAIAIGRAEQVTVTNQQNGRVRRNGIERSFQ